MSDVQVLGLCRWSYPAAPEAFKAQFGTEIDDIRAAVYAPERLELRLFFLEHVVLPSLRAQSDQDFRIVMLMGETLPEPYRGRVLDLIADLPQFLPVFAPEGQNQMEVCHRVMMAGREPDRPVSAEFWCDDDDAVAIDFVRRTRHMFRSMRPFYDEAGKAALDFINGIMLKSSLNGQLDLVPVVARQWTPGLVHYLPTERDATLTNFHHARLWMRFVTLSWPRKTMFIRGAHEFNVSSVNRKPHNATIQKTDPGKLPAVMESRFRIDVDALEAEWRRRCEAGLFGEPAGKG